MSILWTDKEVEILIRRHLVIASRVLRKGIRDNEVHKLINRIIPVIIKRNHNANPIYE